MGGSKEAKLETQTAKDLPVEEKCMGIVITLAQIFQKNIYSSKEATTFEVGEPGATYEAIERAYHLLNEACIENVGIRNTQFILFCRDPSAFFEEPEVYKELQDSVKEVQGLDLVVKGITSPEQVGSAWYLFGYQLKLIMKDENEERRKEWLTTYFGTYYGETPGGVS